MRPRFTPSTGISTLRASSAARRNVPSPPSTSTSSHPSAARSSASTTSISTPSARMSSGARCTGPRSTASAESTRRPMPLSPSTFSTRRAVSVASSRPVCTTSRMVRSQVIAGPRRRPAARPLSASPVRARSVCGAQVQEVLDVAGRSRQRAGGDIDGVPSQFGGAAGDREHRLGAQRRIGHDPAGAHPVLADLELWLHHGNDIGVRRRARGQRGQHRRQRDERQVGDDQVDRPADRVGGEVADVGALHHRHPRIGAQRPGQLAVSDIGGDDLAGTAVQQHLGEAAGRGAGVQAAPAVDGDARRRPGRRSACARRATPSCVRRRRRRSGWHSREIAVAGLAAGMPSMLTRPAPISSAACCRDRARPRRTSSASTRARRVTAVHPFSTDSSACTSRSCASSSRAATPRCRRRRASGSGQADRPATPRSGRGSGRDRYSCRCSR